MSRKKQVYNYLVEAIISNRIPPGTPIVETNISTELNMSRTPIREALQELEAEGLVCRYPSIGTVVSHINPHDVEELFDLRILLEIHALQSSWNKINDQELVELETIFSDLDLKSSKEVYHEGDKRLHSLIVSRAGNMRLKKFHDLLNSQIERFRRIAAFSETRSDKSQKEHLEIIQSLKKRDLKASEDSLRKHLLSVKNSTLEVSKLLTVQREVNK